MNNLFRYLSVFLLISLLSCEEEDSLETDLQGFVSFEAAPVLVDIPENTTKTIEVTVAASESVNTDRTFNIVIDEEETTLTSDFNLPESVTIPANSKQTTISVDLTDDESLRFTRQSLTFNFEDEPNTDFGEPVSIEAAQECLENLVSFNLTLDNFPEETSWELFDLNDPNNPVLIDSAGSYQNPADIDAELVNKFCLASGDYGLAIYDSYGDGGPTYSVSDSSGVLVEETTLEGDQATVTFTVD